MKLAILKAYLKYKLGFSVGLPAFVINTVKECDNGEPLVDIRKADIKLFFGGRATYDALPFYYKYGFKRIDDRELWWQWQPQR